MTRSWIEPPREFREFIQAIGSSFSEIGYNCSIKKLEGFNIDFEESWGSEEYSFDSSSEHSEEEESWAFYADVILTKDGINVAKGSVNLVNTTYSTSAPILYLFCCTDRCTHVHSYTPKTLSTITEHFA